MTKNLETIKNNILKDIEECSSCERDEICNALYNSLKKYDNDSGIKNLFDSFLLFFSFGTKSKIKRLLEDLFDNYKKMSLETKNNLKIELIQISRIHLTFFERVLEILSIL